MMLCKARFCAARFGAGKLGQHEVGIASRAVASRSSDPQWFVGGDTKKVNYSMNLNICSMEEIIDKKILQKQRMIPLRKFSSGSDGTETSSTSKSRVRRRRRRGGSGVDSSVAIGENDERSQNNIRVLAPEPVLNDNEYKGACRAFLVKLITALEPMKACNDPFILTVTETKADKTEWEVTITLGPSDGVYTIATDPDRLSLILSSPISGTHSYVLCRETLEWRGEDDGHSLEGLLVRDLIRQCNGFPGF